MSLFHNNLCEKSRINGKSNCIQILWNIVARDQLKDAYDSILKHSYQEAITVRNGILDAVDELRYQPDRYPLDEFKVNNDGNYRTFELYSYRIAYKITSESIQILRVRHVKREPLEY